MRTLYRAKFKEIGDKGDERLQGRQVTIAGLGGVGSLVTNMLAREGFELRVIDKGRVEEVDMSRMGLYQEQDITKFKAKQAKFRTAEINPKLNLKSFHEELGANNVFLVKSECVIDATNNPDTNALIFNYCQEEKIPVILANYYGSTACVLVATKKLPKKAFDDFIKKPSVDDAGGISPATHAAAAVTVSELFKILLGKGQSKVVTFDVWTGKYKESRL